MLPRHTREEEKPVIPFVVIVALCMMVVGVMAAVAVFWPDK
jgi:uncharacterized membrane protein YidH (DUF202 family)